MSEFEKVVASNQSIAQRKLTRGVGVNDAWYLLSRIDNGKRTTCKTYTRWAAMIKRCYSREFKEENETYADCLVCDEWLLFSSFAEWFEKHYVDGYDLDKDLKVKGNKLYSPSTCMLIPREVNSLLQDKSKHKGNLPVGVYSNKASGGYIVQVRIDGKKMHVGSFESEIMASYAYSAAKNKEIKRKCKQHPWLGGYLIKHLVGG